MFIEHSYMWFCQIIFRCFYIYNFILTRKIHLSLIKTLKKLDIFIFHPIN